MSRKSALFACLLMACDSVGRSIVGEHGTLGVDSCEAPVACEPLEIETPRDVPEPAAPVDIKLCAQAAAMQCASSATTPVSQCAASALELSLNFQGARELTRLGCTAVHVLHAADDPAELRIDLLAWESVRLDFESAEPVTLELAGGRIEQVSLSLHGPIRLRFVDNERVHDLRVQADSAAAQLELERTRVTALSVDAPDGQLLLRRGRVDYANLSVRRLDLESSSVTDASWRAQTLNASDATLYRVRSEVERSVLSACNVTKSSFLSCQSLTAIQGEMGDVHIAKCAEEISIYGGAVVHSQLEGDLLLDAANLAGLALGVGEVGWIRTWDAHLFNISFCADQQELTLGGASAAACVHCDLTPVPSQPAACQLGDQMPRAEQTYGCASLLLVPQCEDPVPERMRPPRR